MIKLVLDKRAAQRVSVGYPWVFRSDAGNAKEMPPEESGNLCQFVDAHGHVVATGYANAKTQLLGRVLSSGSATIDEGFFTRRFHQALAWRQQCFPGQDFYRLVYGESDYLPGLVIDRFGDTLVIQVNTLGMEKLKPIWLPALKKLIPVTNIVFKNDGNTRSIEGLEEEFDVHEGAVPEDGRVPLIENGVKFFADIKEGQKTGWFYDQRPHRAWLSNFAKDKSVIDVFCHTGGFGMTAAVKGASSVTFVDTSAAAIELTEANAKANGVEDKCTFVVGKAFDVLEKMNERFDLVSVDPPAFIKTKKDMATGLKGYEKLARLAANRVEKGGVLFFASCSSHPTEKEVLDAVLTGCAKAKRQASLIYTGIAGPDHPMHPQLPETRYLKAFGFRIY
jgi:23S rRNA (cytosine1962-C5)-methyltransferase